MGTRAQFFIGDPRNIETREWLGTVAWDGYPDGDIGEILLGANTERKFRNRIKKIANNRDDFCDPQKYDFPFPWKNDLFLTDCTYAFFDGDVQFTYYHHGFEPLTKYLKDDEFRENYFKVEDALSHHVPAPVGAGRQGGPDSILILRALK